MKTIEIKPWPATVAPGLEYSAMAYPGTGVYANATGRVAIVNHATSLVLWGEMPGFVDTCAQASPIDTCIAEPSPCVITETTLLKAIALAQNPTLATELLK